MTFDPMLLIALLCLKYGISPADLDTLARQMAEHDAIADAQTGRLPCCE
ncbi:hypothetical protein KCT17_003687 [Escherichia coli]|nr:hypothetical protein [Escherichia coli]